MKRALGLRVSVAVDSMTAFAGWYAWRGTRAHRRSRPVFSGTLDTSAPGRVREVRADA
jgi:hypothetical protein